MKDGSRSANGGMRLKQRPKTERAVTLPALAIMLVVLTFPGCEDAPPNAYIPKPFVEGYLFVDRPIEGVVVLLSQPLTEPYERTNALVRDAEVSISTATDTYPLRYSDALGSYAYDDTTVRVQPGTAYALHVRLRDGTVMTGTTTTPARIAWATRPKHWLQYPADTVQLPSPDSLRIAWTPGNTVEFLIRARCLDTLGYGSYLDPVTEERNGRTNNIAAFETAEYRTWFSTTRWGFVQATAVPTVWTAFRWFGRHSIAVLAPDKHFLDWFKLTQFGASPQYNPEYGSIRGGMGVFGSAAIIEDEVFVLKPKR